MEIIKRLKEPTPLFWKRVQMIGIIIGSIGTALLGAPVTLPTLVITISGYLTTIGIVISTLCQFTSTER
jgi:hypothetical protein